MNMIRLDHITICLITIPLSDKKVSGERKEGGRVLGAYSTKFPSHKTRINSNLGMRLTTSSSVARDLYVAMQNMEVIRKQELGFRRA